MKIYNLKRTQFLPITLSEAWDFFSTPRNLSKITPAKMRFNIRYISGGDKAYAGQIIIYKLGILPGIQLNWTTEITHIHAPNYFIDEQRFGPYALWHHQHFFKAVPGGIEMTDELNYAIPLGFIGKLANLIYVAREVNAIFDYRFIALEKYFTQGKSIALKPL